MQEIILYSDPKSGKDAQRLKAAIHTVLPDKYIETFGALEALKKRLHRFPHKIAVGILFPADKAQLSKLLSFDAVLRDVRIILVLPGTESELISQGHRLRPRFVTQTDSDFSDVATVLAKMINVQQPAPPTRKLSKRGGRRKQSNSTSRGTHTATKPE